MICFGFICRSRTQPSDSRYTRVPAETIPYIASAPESVLRIQDFRHVFFPHPNVQTRCKLGCLCTVNPVRRESLCVKAADREQQTTYDYGFDRSHSSDQRTASAAPRH